MFNEYHVGDNLEVLKKIDDNISTLVYMDPPFAMNRDFDDFNDIWKSDELFIDFLRPRIVEIKRILSKTGNIVVHIDPRISYKVRLLLDEIFGQKNFRNIICWSTGNNKKSKYVLLRYHDDLIVYSKSKNPVYNQLYTEYTDEYVNSQPICPETNLRYVSTAAVNSQPNIAKRPNLRYEWNGHFRQWWVSKEKMQKLHDTNKLVCNKVGIPRIKRYLNELPGIPVRDVWTDIPNIQIGEKLDYATQKPIKLLKRILLIYSNENDVVIDPFAGSGTTGRAALLLPSGNRRYILIDKNPKGKEIFEKKLSAKFIDATSGSLYDQFFNK